MDQDLLNALSFPDNATYSGCFDKLGTGADNGDYFLQVMTLFKSSVSSLVSFFREYLSICRFFMSK